MARALAVSGSDVMPRVIPMKIEWKMMPHSKVSDAAVYINLLFSLAMAFWSSSAVPSASVGGPVLAANCAARVLKYLPRQNSRTKVRSVAKVANVIAHGYLDREAGSAVQHDTPRSA